MTSFISFLYNGEACIGCMSDGRTYLLPYKSMIECMAADFDDSEKKGWMKTSMWLSARLSYRPK